MQAAFSRAKEPFPPRSQAFLSVVLSTVGTIHGSVASSALTKALMKNRTGLSFTQELQLCQKEPRLKNTDGSTCLHPPTRVTAGCVPRARCPAWVCCPEGFRTKASRFAGAGVQSRSLISAKQGQTLLKPGAEGSFECLS